MAKAGISASELRDSGTKVRPVAEVDAVLDGTKFEPPGVETGSRRRTICVRVGLMEDGAVR